MTYSKERLETIASFCDDALAQSGLASLCAVIGPDDEPRVQFTLGLGRMVYLFPPRSDGDELAVLGTFVKVLLNHNEPQMVFDALIKRNALDNLAAAILGLAEIPEVTFDE